jgi:hypothetical protein
MVGVTYVPQVTQHLRRDVELCTSERSAGIAGGGAAPRPMMGPQEAHVGIWDDLPPLLALSRHDIISPRTVRGRQRGDDVIAALPFGRSATAGDGSTRSASETTIAACVLSIKALTSACSAAGTENLSRVVWRSSIKASHSLPVIARCRCDVSMSARSALSESRLGEELSATPGGFSGSSVSMWAAALALADRASEFSTGIGVRLRRKLPVGRRSPRRLRALKLILRGSQGSVLN